MMTYVLGKPNLRTAIYGSLPVGAGPRACPNRSRAFGVSRSGIGSRGVQDLAQSDPSGSPLRAADAAGVRFMFVSRIHEAAMKLSFRLEAEGRNGEISFGTGATLSLSYVPGQNGGSRSPRVPRSQGDFSTPLRSGRNDRLSGPGPHKSAYRHESHPRG
jgi:hypothetical protein